MNKKTVILVRNVSPEMYGGGEKYQLMLAKELKENGFTPMIISSSNKLLQEAKKMKIKAVRAPYSKRQNWSGWRNLLLPVYLMYLKKLQAWYKRIFEQYQPSVVNIQSRDDWIAATKAANKQHIKVLWTDHMDMRSWVFQNVNKKYKNMIGKMIIKNANRANLVIMISDFEKQQVEKMITPYKIENLKVIKNGVIDRKDEFKNIKVNDNSLAFVGRIIWYKGVFELIEAFRTVKIKYPQMQLDFYGTGPDLEKCKSITKEQDGVLFHGYVDEPLEVLAGSRYFVMPSYLEGLSLSLIDAAMMGKVIITTNVDGNPEIVKNNETGVLVESKNVKQLADKMLAVIENKKLANEMAKKARKFYEENFDFDEIFAKKMLSIYNDKKEEE